MLTFISILLSLLVGPQNVELDVAPSVARVDVILDGKTVDSLRSPPWRTSVDLGEELKPHLLEAVAFSRKGRELERIEQWINLPRPRTELKLIVDRASFPPKEARLVWESLDTFKPDLILVSLDGNPLTFDASGRIPLPSLDASRMHLLQAEIELESEVVRAEALIGIELTDEVSTELTAIPVVWKKKSLPSPKDLNRAFIRRGQRLKVATVERAPSDILIVQDQSMKTRSELIRLRARSSTRTQWTGLKDRDRLRVVFPQSVDAEATINADLFPLTENLAVQRTDGARGLGSGAFRLMSLEKVTKNGILNVIPAILEGKNRNEQRLRDAVAVAALRAAAGQRPRAVVLIIEGESQDKSYFSMTNVIRYLNDLRVPLVVWTITDPQEVTNPWPQMRLINSRNKLMWEIQELRTLLDSQIVVWVEGFHPLHEIELTKEASPGLIMVGSEMTVDHTGS